MITVKNPILPGFNPDPSMIRVGDDYYIATSTFEWFPGLQIHHSKDLKNWRLVGHVLTRESQLDMLGNPDSCGVWAPCLSYDNGIFYMIYCNVRSFDGSWKDTPNFMVTCTDIEKGNWSDPIYLDSSGFDASLYHDDDGKKWYVSMIIDHRYGKFFGGIILQEYDQVQQKLVGEKKHIWEGTELGCTEGPHIYKRNGYYYLLTAEGGTEYNHAVSLARSKNIDGPYETHPQNPVISSINNPEAYLQKTGHGSIVESQNGKWYAVFLTSRPLTERGRCPLGRETAIAEVEWREDDWLYLKANTQVSPNELEVDFEEHTQDTGYRNLDTFDGGELNKYWNSLRYPISEDWCSLKKREGVLRLTGQESLSSCFKQSLVARRVTEHNFMATTSLEFTPTSFQHMAGLVCYYNTMHYHYLYLTYKPETNSNILALLTNDKDEFNYYQKSELDIGNTSKVSLRAVVSGAELQYYYSLDEREWNPIGPVLDFSILSDDYAQFYKEKYKAAFTGAFVGMCCQDLTGQKLPADFKYFEYKEAD